MNAIYEDMTGINEIFSLKQMPTLLIEGTCLFYKGYLITSTLEPRFMGYVVQKVNQKSLLWSELDSDQIDSFFETFTLNRFERNASEE